MWSGGTLLMKSATDIFLSCDWGTSSFRLKLVDSATGTVGEAIKTSRGIQDVYNAWLKTGKDEAQEREAFYYRYLRENIVLLAEMNEQDLDGIPVIISGMASSSIGFKELPYASLPVSLEQPDLQLEVRESTGDFPHKLILISGICSNRDVMRGEETQLFGLAARYDIENGICILPGTHSKHVSVRDKAIVDFKTFLTGELFELLSTKSILRNSILPDTPFHDEAFTKGLYQAQQENMLTTLFRIRADEILRHTDPGENYYFLSGLLIGTELATLSEYPSARILLAGEDPLRQLYSKALHFLEIDHLYVTSTENLVVEGHRSIINNMQT